MPRTAADATRFTATGPYAYSKPTPSSTKTSQTQIGSSIALGEGAPANETPQQKIARLRAAASRARLGQESQFDKVVRVGRVWADRAHRTTAWSLIGLTVVCGVFATFSIGDMLLHNRRKRNEWLAEQKAKSAVLLEEARVAASRGIANDDQILLLNRERAAREAEEQKRAEKGLFSRAREALGGGGGAAGAAKVEASRGNSEVRASETAPSTRPLRPSGFLEDVNSDAGLGAGSAQLQPAPVLLQGGPLDRQAAASTDVIVGASRSWWHSITGR